jgi:hypothetical protein
MALMRHLLVIGRKHGSLVNLFLPPAHILEKVDFESVKPRYLDNSGQVLDLRDIEARVLAARSRMEDDTLWADGENTPDPTTLDELNRRMLKIEDAPPIEVIEETSREALAPADCEQAFFELTQRKSPLRHFGKTITVGTIKNPSSGLTKDEQNKMIDALNFTGRSQTDMYDHVIPVAEVVVVFKNQKPIAFGVGNEIDFQNNGSTEKLEYLVATMSRKGNYGRGLQTVVNGLFLTKRKQFGRKDPFVMMRTNSVGPMAGFWKYFAGVVWQLFKPADLRRAREFSRFMGCECDENGIVRNAYTTPPTDPVRDEEILKSIERKNPRLYNRIKEVKARLGPQDAQIFIGRINYLRKILIKAYIKIVFRIRNWWQERIELRKSETS